MYLECMYKVWRKSTAPLLRYEKPLLNPEAPEASGACILTLVLYAAVGVAAAGGSGGVAVFEGSAQEWAEDPALPLVQGKL